VASAAWTFRIQKRKGRAMLDFFYLVKGANGITSLKVPVPWEGELAKEFRLADDMRGVGLFGAIVLLQQRISTLEQRISTLEAHRTMVPESTCPPQAKGKISHVKRMGRADRCRFGYRLDRNDDKRLVPDLEEQETIRHAQALEALGMSVREICRKLDQQGRNRRGKRWENAHSLLRDVLLRNKQS